MESNLQSTRTGASKMSDNGLGQLCREQMRIPALRTDCKGIFRKF